MPSLWFCILRFLSLENIDKLGALSRNDQAKSKHEKPHVLDWLLDLETCSRTQILPMVSDRLLTMSTESETSRRILLVDPELASSAIITEALRWDGHQVICVKSFDQAFELVDSAQPDLILVDFDNLDFQTGLDLLTFVRSRPRYVAVVFMSNKVSSQNVMQGLDVGADDFITKSFEPLELLARVRRQLRSKDLYDQLAEANERLKELVDIDDLTGLYNMRSVYQKIESELQRSMRFNRSVCVVMLDMDHFKSVNDGHDHLFGSYVISQMGQIIQRSIRSIDIGARYGGDEFLMMLTETTTEGALQFCERLREVVKKTLFTNDGDEIQLTVSIGFAITQPGNSHTDSRSLVRAADHALYQAKNAGRDCVQYVQIKEPHFDQDIEEELRLVQKKHPELSSKPGEVIPMSPKKRRKAG